MGNLFSGIYGIFNRNFRAFIFFLILLMAFIAYFASGISFEEDINKVIPASEKNRSLIRVLEHSKFADRLVFCLSTSTPDGDPAPELLIAFARSLMDSLQSPRAAPYIKKIEGRFAPKDIPELYGLLYDQLPLFLEESDYRSIENMLTDPAIKAAVKKDYEALMTAGGFAMRDMILKDPLSLTPLALKKLERLKVSDNFILFRDHIFTQDKNNLLFFLIPENPATETSDNARLIELIEGFNNSLGRHYENKVTVHYFGSMVIAGGNAAQIKKDIIITLSIAAIILLIFLGLYFRKKTSLLLLFLPALLGGGTAVAILAIFKGEVSAISLGLGSVMLGISIDYALHFLSHLRNSGSVRTVIRDIASPVMISSLTTASAFLCLMVLNSEALRDLGLFASVSVFSSAVFTLIVLPQFFREESVVDHKKLSSGLAGILIRAASYPYDRNKKLVLFIFILLVVFIFSSRRVQFESNMDSMNYMSPELVRTENFLDSISDYKLRSVFIVSDAENLDQALENNERLIPVADSLLAKGVLHAYTSVHPFYPSSEESKRRIRQWKAFWDHEKINHVKTTIISTSQKYRFRQDAFSSFYDLMEYRKAPDRESLEPLREAFLVEYISENDSLAMVTTICKVEAGNKSQVYAAFENKKNVTVFDRQSLTTSFMEGLNDSFNTLILVSLLVVFLILTLSFGRIELGIITFIPLLISWVFTLGIMGLLGIRFNIFNVVISTFIFGLGIDYAIFTLRGLMHEYQYGHKKLNSFKTSILLSGITTITGIGVLIFAKHPALQSIAISAIIGIISVILITYTLLPRLFRFLVEHEGRPRKWPATLKDFIFSINTLMIFLVGVIILDIAGLILRFLIPMPLKKKKLLFHKMLSVATWVIVYGSVNIKKIIWNRSGEDFKKPAIVICNHQSHLDTVLTIMQNPRMILLTNPWVHKSIFYRGFIRFADFYSVEEGINTLKEKIKAIVAEGYSVLYFPEGTRSPDLEIGRFHQGAFHMAKELNLDIIPIISYGSGNVMPKFEPFLKTSPATMTIMPRIGPDNPLIKETSLATAKAVRQYYIKEYAAIRKKIETPAFIRKKVIRNYLYRGPVLEWYMKVKIRLDDHYKIFHEYLPEKGMITDIGCGYGFMAYMLKLMAPERKFTAYDYDAGKIDTANHCALKTGSIHFIHADITKTQIPESNAFLLIDVLHYLPPEEQEALIRNCIENLAPQGIIIIREADIGMKKKHLGTRISEILSTGFGFNKTRGSHKKLYFRSKEKYLDIFAQYDLDVDIIDETKMNSNLIYILKNKAS
ncbi:MAG: MMPL family transporter [Bacteroidales bacterium]|nr:MMPL family transporter [Bacteroidales bacterium]